VPDARSIALRTAGFLGALLVVISTFVAWYDFDVAFVTLGVAHAFVVPVDLWSLYPLAAALLSAGAIACVTIVAFGTSRALGAVGALLGLGIVVYSGVRILDIPALEVGRLPANVPATAQAATNLDGGAFMALLGGILLCFGALSVLMPSETPARAPSAQSRVAPA
jgi:hypothetical protein